jgi:hypothetical protein
MNKNRRTTLKQVGMALAGASLPLRAFAGTPPAPPTTTPRQLQVVPAIAPPQAARSVAENKDPRAYLLAYFNDETHSLFFATSRDGYTFTDVNNASPVLNGKDIAQQKGIRDPHIMRGPDNAFYLAMTDLHIYGRRDGLRNTEWERPGDRYGWGNNRNLVLMKSWDLIHWTHALFDVAQAFPEAGDLGCAWAPQTIFDPAAGRLMVYFTTRAGGGANYMVYAYADDAFTRLVTAPKPLYAYPDPKKNTIDADITKVGDKYHMFYVAHDGPNGIRHAVSDRINTGYSFEPRRVDWGGRGTEAPNLWRRLGTDVYVLMYDVYSGRPNNMGFAETTDFVTYKDLGKMNEPGSPMKGTNFSRPKHGAVVHITLDELDRLKAYFGGV